MSRQLPPHPNLEHLRKQAKRLLEQMAPDHPEWTLADAQHALARSYGFSSWPRLKAHVQAADGAAAGPNRPGGAGDRAGAHQPGQAPDPSIASGAPHPLSGAWVADVAASRRHPSFPFRAALLVIEVEGDRVSLAQRVEDPEGREISGRMAIRADGHDHPAESGGGHVLNARLIGDRELETLDKKDGEVLGRGVYRVSEDGRQLTVETAGQYLVFDRRR